MSRPPRRITSDEFFAEAHRIHGDRYDYSQAEFRGLNTRITLICRTHGPFTTLARNHLDGRQCVYCAKKGKKTTEMYIADARAVHGDRYDYSRVVYTRSTGKIEVVCREHGSFFPQANNHLNCRSGCPTCSGHPRLNRDDFIARAIAAHGEKYDYSRVIYKNVDTKVEIVCPEHGPFEQIPYDHTSGRGCRRCGAIQSSVNNSRRVSLDQFLSRARAVHGDRYDYSQVEFRNVITPVTLVCPDHGPFVQAPAWHMNGNGCAACAGLAAITPEQFIERSIAAHGDRYDYSRMDYTGFRRRVLLRCPEHGEFRQVAREHAAGHGCPRCAREATASQGEQEVADWLTGCGFEIVRHDREVLDGFEMDIFVPGKRLGIEYHGSYWHHDTRMVHPRIHEVKALRAVKAGIHILTVWDFDWAARRDLVQAMILHQLGASSGPRVHARACRLDRVDVATANAFYQRAHIQGGTGRVLAGYGLWDGGRLVACMSFSQGASRRGKSGPDAWELTRFATEGIVRGGASRLFAAFVREHAPQVVWSFSDRQTFAGGLYPALGFIEDGRVKADYRVCHVNARRVWHKSAWQRKYIPARLAELGIDEPFDPAADPRTEWQMQELAGVVRIMDAGKVRWRWQAGAGG